MDLPKLYSRLTPQERREVREEYVLRQKGLCMFCKGSLNQPPDKSITDKRINWRLFPPNFLKYPVHLQHCHETDKTEGAVHAYCNAVLWQYHGR
jgi:hypothetical protein